MTESFARREFARRTALASLALGTASMAEAAQEKDSPKPDAVPTQVPPERLRRPEKLLLDVIKQRYPSEQLSPEILAEIERDIAASLRRRRDLKSVSLDNGDAPFVFRAFLDETAPVT